MIVDELQAVFDEAREAIRLGADEATAVAILGPFLTSPTGRCSLVMSLARVVVDIFDTLPDGSYVADMRSRDAEIADVATTFLIATGNHDMDAVCHLFHQLDLEDQAAVIASLLHVTTALVRGS